VRAPGDVDAIGADGHPRLELMFRLSGGAAGRDAVLTALADGGQSVAVTGRAGQWTCHVHTDDVDGVLAAMAGLGDVGDVRVEPLRPAG
jgi:dihydroxyacetone kinase-like predicted kinase